MTVCPRIRARLDSCAPQAAGGGLGNWLRPEATEGRQCSSRGRPADQGDLSSEISLAALAHCFNTASNSVNERGALVPTRGAS